MKSSWFLAALTAAAPAWAQEAVPTVVVTGNPLGRTDVAAPNSVLSGDALAARRSSTLGETLDGLPGVSASAFGPNASRPIIRGQDGDRIRLLTNGGASVDASGLSNDHAVPIDPLVVERLEVLRGPAALLYGGGAIGGVVNAIDHRIPDTVPPAVTGLGELRLGGAARERATSGLVEGGADGLAWHADAFARETSDLLTPRFARPQEGGGSLPSDRVVNSASQASGGAVGVSRVGADGYLGVSIDRYRNHYGVVAEDDVTIRMQRDKFALAGETRALDGWLRTVRGQLGYTDYEHREIEGSGAIGTVFRTRGSDARLEAVQRAVPLAGAALDGVLGLQAEATRFSALGEEAFVPTTHTRQVAAFVMERLSWGDDVDLSAGLRGEQVRVSSDGDADSTAMHFGAASERRFAPSSASLSAAWRPAPHWQLSLSGASTERAPTSYELYADGVHAATAAYERGNPGQRLERGHNLDLGAAWHQGGDHVKLNVFTSRFSNYIALLNTGAEHIDDQGSATPIYAFAGVPARLRGLEFDSRWQLPAPAGQALSLAVTADALRGERLDSGEPLPRLAPLRASATLQWTRGAWSWSAAWQGAARQTRVPADDTPTPGWGQVHLGAQWQGQWQGHDLTAGLKLNNLGDTLAYQASAIATVRQRSPMAGRSLSADLRLSF